MKTGGYYKSALHIGDVVRLQHKQIVGLLDKITKFEKGTELKVIEKTKYTLSVEDKDGRKITWLLSIQNPDLYVDYVGKQFS